MEMLQYQIAEVGKMSAYYVVKATEVRDTPEDPEVFEREVISAIKQLYSDGSRSMKIYSIYTITKWKRNSSTSRRIYFVLKKHGVKKINDTHYTMGDVAEFMENENDV